MRDPDLVQRAERAAMALERAWGHWRVMHGLGTDPLPPVSSYVGYSLEEPWGQPRVVFGVGAEEAERLAALLAGHDCIGPVHAEVSARPDWRLAASGGPAAAQGRAFDGAVSVPAQAPPPGAEPSERDARHVNAAADAGDVDGGPAGVGRYLAAPAAMDGAAAGGYRADQDEAEPPGSPVSPIPAEPASAPPTAAAAGSDRLEPLPADPHEPRWLSGAPDGSDPGQSQPDPGGPHSDQRDAAGRAGSIPPPAEFWQHGEPAGTVELAAVEEAGVVAFRRRPEQLADQWQEQIPARDGRETVPSQGPGYHGRRYQGFPPKYQPGPGQQDPPALFGAPTEDAAGEPSGVCQPAAVPSGGGQPEAMPADAREPEAMRADAGEPEVMRADAGEPEVMRADAGEPEMPGGAGQPEAEPSGARRPTASGPGTSQPSASQPSAGQPSASRPKAVQSEGGESEAGQAGARQSATGQSTTSRSKTGQPKTAHSRTGQSGGQPKPGQPRAVQSRAGQTRQTSPAGSTGRASGREAGKRPRG